MAYQAAVAKLATRPGQEAFPLPPKRLFLIKTADGLTLRAAFWDHSDGQAAHGTVLILQGRTEFIEKYAEVIAELRERGFAVVAFDWRGQGLSERQVRDPAKGHVEDFEDYLLDLSAIISQMNLEGCPKPWTMLAHSMGGGVALLALAYGPSPFDRAIITAPLVGLPGFKGHIASRMTARLLTSLGLSRSFVPGGGPESFPLAEAFATNALTSDETRYTAIGEWLRSEPRLALGSPTIGWVDAAFIAMERLRDAGFGKKNRTPILMMLASDDDVVSTRAAEALGRDFRGASSMTLPGARHEILMERDDLRALFWKAFDAFAAREPVSDASHSDTKLPETANP